MTPAKTLCKIIFPLFLRHPFQPEVKIGEEHQEIDTLPKETRAIHKKDVRKIRKHG
jgi:hypothetical protein